MRVGFSQIFPFRPHPSIDAYLRHLTAAAGHSTYGFECGGGGHFCYSKAMRKNSAVECLKCRVGGVRSFAQTGSISTANKMGPRDIDIPEDLLTESAGFLFRVETVGEQQSQSFLDFREKFRPFMRFMCGSALRWIEENQIEALVLFNGRQDGTAAVRHAAEIAGIPYITHERTWFGPGISLNPGENCNSMRHLGAMARAFDQSPLRREQAELAFGLLASRFKQENEFEWRLYNPDPVAASWPGGRVQSSALKVLVLPSSRCEFVGSREYETVWGDNLIGMGRFLDKLCAESAAVVIRGHPVWSQRIGPRSGENIQQAYRSLAESHGVHYIPSESRDSTYDLIKQADIVVLNGGSSAVEAGFLGKRVVLLGTAPYAGLDFVETLASDDDIDRFDLASAADPSGTCASTLRYVYTRYGRFPQYCDFVRPRQTTLYDFYQGGGPDRLMQALTDQRIQADDPEIARDGGEERQFVEKALDGRFSTNSQGSGSNGSKPECDIGPRMPYSLIHTLRKALRLGDNR